MVKAGRRTGRSKQPTAPVEVESIIKPGLQPGDFVRIVGTDFTGIVSHVDQNKLTAVSLPGGLLRVFPPENLELIEPPEPQPERPAFNEGDRVRGQRVSNGEWIEGIVDCQNDAVVFVSNDQHQMAGLAYEGIELLERAEPQEQAGNALDQLLAAFEKPDPYIQPMIARDPAYSVALEPGDWVVIEADDDLSGNVVSVKRILPTFEVELNVNGMTLSYERHQLRLERRGGAEDASPTKTEVLAAYQRGAAARSMVEDAIEPPWATTATDLDRLAIAINQKHQECEASQRRLLKAARDAGNLLLEARAKCNRNFLKWLKTNFRGSQRTAYNYMAIAENWRETLEPVIEADTPLGMRQALALLNHAENPEPEETAEEASAPVIHQIDYGDRLEQLQERVQSRISTPDSFNAQVDPTAEVPGQLMLPQIKPTQAPPLETETKMKTPDFETIAHCLKQAEPLEIHIEAARAYALVGQMQLALRHPLNTGPTAEMAREMAQNLQRRLGLIHPEIARSLDAGWQPELDATDEEFREDLKAGEHLPRIKVHNVFALHELDPNGQPAQRKLLMFSRPQDWGHPRWHYHTCTVQFEVQGVEYTNSCHVWQEVERSPIKAFAAVGEAMYWMIQPGEPPQLCGREYLAEEDFWDETWGAMPPVWLSPDEDDGGYYDDPVVLYDPIAGPITDSQFTTLVDQVAAMSPQERQQIINEQEGDLK